MMDKLKGSKKRIIAAVIAAVLTVAAVAGIATAVRATTSSTVPVIPVSDLNYGSYLDWQNSVTGMITTEAEQNVYLSDTEKVQEVLVQEGQAVHKGDVLLRYDTKSTRLSLEKEKLNKEKIELSITVAKENIRILENTSPVSDGSDFGFVGDFYEYDETEIYKQAEVHEKILKADSKPVSDDPEDITLGTEYAPYVFLCKGNSVVITKDFIKKWQKEAAKKGVKQLYIELAVRDSAQNLQKAWITDIMLLDVNYDIEVDLATGKTAYAEMNDPEQMAVFIRKLLLNVPEDERGAWVAAMLDKLMITTEQEDRLEKRGELLAAALNELSKEDQEEFAAAAALLNEETLSVMFKSLSENLTPEQITAIDQESLAGMLTLLLRNMSQEQVQAIDTEVLAAFLEKLSAEQIGNLDSAAISAMLAGMSTEQVQNLDQAFLDKLFSELTQEQMEELDPESIKLFYDKLTQEQLKALIEVRGDEIEELLNKQKEEEEKQKQEQEQEQASEGQSSQGQSGSQSEEGQSSEGQGSQEQSGSQEEAGQGASGKQTDPDAQPEEQKENPSSQDEPKEDEPAQEEPQQEEAAQNEPDTGSGDQEETAEPVQEQENPAAGETVPTTASSTTTGGSGSQILSEDISYTSDELAKAKREAKDKLRDLELSLRESDLKIEKAEKALDEGVVTANMNGVVKTAGDPAAPPTDGSAFITVAGSEGLYVRSGIKESKLGTLSEGDHVTITSWQTGGQYEAEIKSISPYPDSTGMFDNSATETYFPFTASLLDKDAVLQNGEWVEVSYTASSGGSRSSLSVMKAFVREEGSKKYVYVRDENNKLKKQYIITGTLSDSGYEVLDGLSESDWIAFPYGKNVKEGAKTRESSVSELYNS